MAVALVGSPGDPQLSRVAGALERLGSAHFVLDAATFPGETRLAFGFEGLSIAGRLTPLPHAAYVRGLACHPLMPSLAELLEQRPRRVIAAMEEKRALLESLLLDWESQGVRLVNSPAANAQHSRKPLQLAMLERAGLPVPRWLASNDPATLRAFTKEVGATVYKPLAGGATVRLVETEDLLPQRMEHLAAAPVLFQQFIEGTSVRAYAIDGEVVGAAEIHSPEVDYRREEGEVVPTELTPEEAAIAISAARICGMPFSGVDLIRTPDKTWLLECNPSPMFAVFEDKTGIDVATPLAALLART
ncbi:MAG: hypothetical protein RLZZ303_2586 [Candidatus Hydrogenedentota bacterium]